MPAKARNYYEIARKGSQLRASKNKLRALLYTSWRARRLKFKEIILKKKFEFCLAYVTPSYIWVSTKIQPIRSSGLVGQRELIYECLVLLFRYIGKRTEKQARAYEAPWPPPTRWAPMGVQCKYIFEIRFIIQYVSILWKNRYFLRNVFISIFHPLKLTPQY